jgi:hypothetical protein
MNQWENSVMKQDDTVPIVHNKNIGEDEPANDRAEASTWKQHAGFSIFFDYKLDENGNKQWHTRLWKIQAYHNESGESREIEGVDTEAWVKWIMEKAGFEAMELPVTAEASLPKQKKTSAGQAIVLDDFILLIRPRNH